MTDISGELGGMVLTPAGNPYHLVADAFVSPTLTFTAQPGVEIRADGFFEIRIFGIVNITGVHFHSNQPVPSKGDWKGIFFENNDPTSDFDGNTIEDAEFGIWGYRDRWW